MHISRHLIDKQAMAVSYKAYQSLKDNALTDFETDVTMLDDLSGYFINLFFYSSLFDNDDEEALDWLDRYIEASVANYRLADSAGETVSFEFMHKKYTIVPPEKIHGVTIPDWTRVYLSAIIRRNKKATGELAAIDLDNLKRKEKAKGFEYNFLFAEFLQHLFDDGVDHGKTLVRASKASMEVPKSSLVYDYMLDIGGPQIDLFTYILFKDEEKFNDQLKKALESFKKYYERQGEQGKKDPNGLVSIPLSAIVLLAKDEGIAIHHTSDYLPAYLIDAD